MDPWRWWMCSCILALAIASRIRTLGFHQPQTMTKIYVCKYVDFVYLFSPPCWAGPQQSILLHYIIRTPRLLWIHLKVRGSSWRPRGVLRCHPSFPWFTKNMDPGSNLINNYQRWVIKLWPEPSATGKLSYLLFFCTEDCQCSGSIRAPMFEPYWSTKTAIGPKQGNSILKYSLKKVDIKICGLLLVNGLQLAEICSALPPLSPGGLSWACRSIWPPVRKWLKSS